MIKATDKFHFLLFGIIITCSLMCASKANDYNLLHSFKAIQKLPLNIIAVSVKQNLLFFAAKQSNTINVINYETFKKVNQINFQHTSSPIRSLLLDHSKNRIIATFQNKQIGTYQFGSFSNKNKKQQKSNTKIYKQYYNNDLQNSHVFLNIQNQSDILAIDQSPQLEKTLHFYSDIFQMDSAFLLDQHISEGQQIISIDSVDTSQNIFAAEIIKNQEKQLKTYRMVIWNFNANSAINFEQTSNELTFVKFSTTGLYLFVAALNYTLSVYKLDQKAQSYSYITSFDTTSYEGHPKAIISTSDQFFNVAVGSKVLMLKIINNKIFIISTYQVSPLAQISCLNEINDDILIGTQNGDLHKVKIVYSMFSDEKISKFKIFLLFILSLSGVIIISALILYFILKSQYKKENKQIKRREDLKNRQLQEVVEELKVEQDNFISKTNIQKSNEQLFSQQNQVR